MVTKIWDIVLPEEVRISETHKRQTNVHKIPGGKPIVHIGRSEPVRWEITGLLQLLPAGSSNKFLEMVSTGEHVTFSSSERKIDTKVMVTIWEPDIRTEEPSRFLLSLVEVK